LTNERFWPHVLFTNFLPLNIGGPADKFKTAHEQHDSARDRVEQILLNHLPDRVLVFSSKAWAHFAYSDEEKSQKRCHALFDDPAESRYSPEFGTYTVGKRKILVGGFRHPQGADAVEMKKAVAMFMGLPG